MRTEPVPFRTTILDAWCGREIRTHGTHDLHGEDALAIAATQEALAIAAWEDGDPIEVCREYLTRAEIALSGGTITSTPVVLRPLDVSPPRRRRLAGSWGRAA